MTFDKDLQVALIRNEQVDSQLREMQINETSSQIRNDLEDIQDESNQKSSDLHQDLQEIESENGNKSSELQDDLKDFDIQSTHKCSEVDYDVHDMEVINRKIREYTAKLKFWMDKKKHFKEKQAIVHAGNLFKPGEVIDYELIYTPPDKKPPITFEKRNARNVN